MIDYKSIEKSLYDAMHGLYEARYKTHSREAGKPDSFMDEDIFGKIASLQSELQKVISDVQRKSNG